MNKTTEVTENGKVEKPVLVDAQDENVDLKNVIEILRQQLDDAHLVIGQKEMQIQRQNALIRQLRTKA